MKPSPPITRSNPRIGAFTLVEVVLALAISAIILIGVQSAVMLAVRAIPNDKAKNSVALNASAAMDTIDGEMRYATSFQTISATTVIFTVPDRNGDSKPDQITYSWSGKLGDPLLRTLNAGTPQPIVADVQAFSLAYDRRTTQVPQTYTEGAEIQLIDCTALLSLGDYKVQSSAWCGQYFKPNLPANATSWRITRARVWVKYDGLTTGITGVQVRVPNGSLPSTTVIDEAQMYESGLGASYGWAPVTFSNAGGLSPSLGACIVFAWISGGTTCDVQYQLLGALGVTAYFVTTSNSGSTWTIPIAEITPMTVWGKVSTADPVSYTYTLMDVRCTLTVGSTAPARLATVVRILNEPTVNATDDILDVNASAVPSDGLGGLGAGVGN